MSSFIDGSGKSSPSDPVSSADNQSKRDQEGGLDNDLDARVAEQAGETFRQLDERSFFRTSSIEAADNTLRDRIVSQEDDGGGLNGILARIRRVVRGWWRSRRTGVADISREERWLLSKMELHQAQDSCLERKVGSSQNRMRIFFQSVFDSLLSCIRRSHAKIDLRGFSADSPEGFLALSMIARTIIKVSSRRQAEHTNNYVNKDEFIDAINNSMELIIPSVARIEALFSELDQAKQESIPLIRGIALLTFLPRNQQVNLKKKIQQLARLDFHNDYTYLIDAAERMDNLTQKGSAEAEAITSMLHIFRMDLNQFLGNGVVRCYERFKEDINFRFLKALLDNTIPQVYDLFHDPKRGAEQTEFLQELVMKLYVLDPVSFVE